MSMPSTQLLSRRLELVFHWYEGMVNPRTGLLEYLYLPDSDVFVREQSPIRDIGSVWDIALVSAFLKRDDLRGVIERSLAKYSTYLVRHETSLILDPRRLGEPSSIAHSAFMILALLRSPKPQSSEVVSLAESIIRQQRPDGSYKVYFDDIPDSGEELYAGEAMLALLEAHRALGGEQLLNSATRAFNYYDAHYFREGRVADDLLVFFANWQSQACRLLFENAKAPELAGRIARFLFAMHDRVVDSGFFDAVEHEPRQQVSVAVACALEGLNDAYAVARATQDERLEPYRRAICTCLTYLLELQIIRSEVKREVGGFGMSSYDRTQRIDVTGHAASAFLKAIENDISCADAPLGHNIEP